MVDRDDESLVRRVAQNDADAVDELKKHIASVCGPLALRYGPSASPEDKLLRRELERRVTEKVREAASKYKSLTRRSYEEWLWTISFRTLLDLLERRDAIRHFTDQLTRDEILANATVLNDYTKKAPEVKRAIEARRLLQKLEILRPNKLPWNALHECAEVILHGLADGKSSHEIAYIDIGDQPRGSGHLIVTPPGVDCIWSRTKNKLNKLYDAMRKSA